MIHKQITFASVGYGCGNDNKENNKTERKRRKKWLLCDTDKKKLSYISLSSQVSGSKGLKTSPRPFKRVQHRTKYLIPVE